MSLFFVKKVFLHVSMASLLFVFCSVHAWPVSLVILRDTVNKHLICLIGDHHAENSKETQEANAISFIKKPLQKVLESGNVACLIEAEPGRFDTVIRGKTKNYKNTSEKKIFIKEYVEGLSFINQLSSGLEYNASAIIPADWRTDEISSFILFYALTIPTISSDFYNKILKKMKEENLDVLYEATKKQGAQNFMIAFFKDEERKKMQENGLKDAPQYYINFTNRLVEEAQKKPVTFKNVITLLDQQIERIKNAEQYAPDFSKNLVKNLNNIKGIIKKNAKTFGGEDALYFTYDIYMASKKHQDFTFLIDVSRKGTLQKLLKNNLVDFGYIIEIEKARKKFPIVLLYAGENHTKYIQDYLKKKDYNIVFEIENNSDQLPEKKDLLEFFNIIQEESDLISQKKEKEEKSKKKE